MNTKTTIPEQFYKIHPWDHQRSAVEECEQRSFYALFHEMGTGKTGTVINILRRKFTIERRPLRTLILTPLGVVRQFHEEFLKFGGPQYKHLVLSLAGETKKVKLKKLKDFKGSIYITNHEMFTTDEIVHFFWEQKLELLIVDESHLYKNCESMRTKKILGLVDGKLMGRRQKMITTKEGPRMIKVFTKIADHSTPIKYRFVLTGSPILNSITDIWAQMRILSPYIFPNTFTEFSRKYQTNANPPGAPFPKIVTRKGAAEAVNNIIMQYGSRVKKEDCLTLPPLVKTRLDVPMTPEQNRLYQEMKNKLVAYMADSAMVAEIALTKSLRLLQILCGVFVADDGATKPIKSNRLKVLEDCLSGLPPNSQLIVWTNFASTYDSISKVLDKLEITHGRIVGGQTNNARVQVMDDFAQGTIRCVLANQKAGGTGINLTQASYSIYYSRSYALGEDLQSQARNYRGGSNIHEKVTRIDLVTPNSIDTTILGALSSKLNLAELVLRVKEGLNED